MLEIEIVNNINTYLECKGIHFSNELRMGVGIPDISLNIGEMCIRDSRMDGAGQRQFRNREKRTDRRGNGKKGPFLYRSSG